MADTNRGYFNRGRGRGRGRGRAAANGDNSNAENPAKKRKFNPFWRARGGQWRSFNGNPQEKPVTVQLPAQITAPVMMAVDDDDDPLEEQNVPAASVSIDCLGNKDYPFWRLYFPFLEYEDDLVQRKHISAFTEYLTEVFDRFDLDSVLTKHSFKLNFMDLCANQTFMYNFPDFREQLKEDPDNVLQTAAIAMHQLLQAKGLDNDREVYQTRLTEYRPITSLERALDAINIDSMVSLRGTVMRVSDPEYRDRWQVFKCIACQKEQLVYQPNGRKTQPFSCYQGCRNRSKFTYVNNSPYRVPEPCQHVRVQESIYTNKTNSAVNYINVLLKYDLVDSLSPGDDIILTGVLKVTREITNPRLGITTAKEYIEATSVTGASNAMTVQRLQFTDKDLLAIQKIRDQPSTFRLLVNSLNPKIYGHEMVKAGLILSLFGGGSNKSARENIHILMVGDPGMGKSELLGACCSVAPKAIYSVSSGVSHAGLTASVRRVANRYVVEAGVLVLADGGVCCIDEIDKTVSMHNDLLDAMERQKVSVVKMGNRVNLMAKTTIIAAGNPIGSMYDKTKTITENLKMGPALLSRFDLVFIMTRDDSDYNDRLARFKMNGNVLFSTPSQPDYQSNWELENFLRLKSGERMEYLPHILLQNYVAYSRNKCFPKLPENVADVLEEFYLEMRQLQRQSNILPLTIRQLQALRRLAVARARVDMAEVVTMQHAREMIELTKYSYMKVFETETGELDLTRGIHGSGISKRNKKMQFFEILKKNYERTGINQFTFAQMKQIASEIQLDKLYEVVDSLNVAGYLLMVGSNTYKIVTS